MWNSIRNHLHSFILRLFAICTIFSISTSPAFASTIGSLNNSVSFNFMNIAEFKASANAYFSNSSASPEYMAISSLFGSFVNTFGPQYSYYITSNNTGTPASYFETKDVNKHLRDISLNQWYINQNISRLYDRYYTYSDGNAALLNQINTNTTNMYGSQSATNVQLANLNNKTSWTNISFSPLYKDNNQNNVTKSDWQVVTNPFYMQLPNYSRSDVIFRVWMPITYQGYPNNSNFSVELTMYQNGVTILPENIYAQASQYGTEVYFVAPYLSSQQTLYLKISNTAGLRFSNSSPVFQVIDSSNIMYPQYLSFFQYKKLINKTDDIVNAINNKDISIDGSGIEITGVIPIINTVVDKDIKLTVPITDNDLDDVSDTVNTLDDWTNTGVSISDALDGINDMLNVFFTSENRHITTTLSNGYTDYYN